MFFLYLGIKIKNNLMFKNYLKIGIRNILTQKIFSFINIIGLSVGITAFILIFLYVQSELSFDKHWEKSANIYRLTQMVNFGEHNENFALTCFSAGRELKSNFPEVKEVLRISSGRGERDVVFEEDKIKIDKIHYTDSTFFKIFDFKLLEGNKNNVLNKPKTIAIERKVAEKFFGKESALGKILKFNERDFEVCAVFEKPLFETHLSPNILISMNTLNPKYVEDLNSDLTRLFAYTYLYLEENTNINNFEKKIKEFLGEIATKWVEKNKLSYKLDFSLQTIASVHFDLKNTYNISESSDKKYIYIFSYVAFFILLIACINYINLSTAKSMKRAKEVGVRKLSGASKRTLIFQFLLESIIITFISLIISLILVEIFLPSFINLAYKDAFLFHHLFSFSNIYLILSLLLVILLVGLFSGSFPAFVLSSFRPIDVLKGSSIVYKGKLSKKSFTYIFRIALVILQFTISISMIIATFVVFSQINFMKNKDLGFDKEKNLIVEFKDRESLDKISLIKEEFSNISNIKIVSSSASFPGDRHGKLTFYIYKKTGVEQAMLNFFFVDENYKDLLNLKMIDGRFFSKEFSTDTTMLVINEAALKYFDEGVGQVVKSGYTQKGKIIGVMKNYNYHSLENDIEPLIICCRESQTHRLGLKMQSDDLTSTINEVKKIWHKFFKDKPLVYHFLDENFDKLYKKQEHLLKIFTYFSFLIVFIACLGLFGLSSFLAEQKTKEIGIRKVLGASVLSIVILIAKQFVKWVLISNIFAFPIAYFFMDKWLQDFAYRIDLTWDFFILSALIAFVVSIFTVSYQALIIANLDPVKTLRYE